MDKAQQQHGRVSDWRPKFYHMVTAEQRVFWHLLPRLPQCLGSAAKGKKSSERKIRRPVVVIHQRCILLRKIQSRQLLTKFGRGVDWWPKVMWSEAGGCIFKTVALRAFWKLKILDLAEIQTSPRQKADKAGCSSMADRFLTGDPNSITWSQQNRES